MISHPKHKTADTWRLEGNAFCQETQFVKAIECYDQALRLTGEQDDAIILLLNRCHARNASQHFDAALADADAVLAFSRQNEKALFRAARALYGLRRYEECRARLTQVIVLYPANLQARKDLDRCNIRLREQQGEYDYGAMLDEAVRKSPAPDMDRGSYIGSVEVRLCAIESRGRGLFTTKDVKAGELLLVEKAFTVAFQDEDDPNAPYEPSTGLRSSKPLARLRAELTTTTFAKLHRNPSALKAFASLYPGSDAEEELTLNLGDAFVNNEFVQRRIMYNGFAFPILSKAFHWRVSHEPESLAAEPRDPNGCIGTWVNASFINHSCYPNVRRSFIGDMMIFRAQQAVAVDTELTLGYISGFEDYAGRQEDLNRYGFTCVCSMCEGQRTTPAEKFKKRSKIMQDIIGCFEKPTATDVKEYYDFLTALDLTYVHPQRAEPRQAFIVPCANLVTACAHDKMPSQVIHLGLILLRALGFEMNVTTSTFEITYWGLLTDEVVPVLADMWTAYGTVAPAVVEQVEKVAKMAYLIIAGEDVSFEGAYGSCRPRFQEMNGDEEMMGLVGEVKEKMKALGVGT